MQLPDINVQMWPADFSSLFSFRYTHNPFEIKNKTKKQVQHVVILCNKRKRTKHMTELNIIGQ